MNIPGITRALELDDADWDLAVKLRALTEYQREQFATALGPVKTQKKPASKQRTIEHCDACDYTRRHQVHKVPTYDGYHEFQPKVSAGKKSVRASGIAQQLGKNLAASRQRTVATGDNDDNDDTDGFCQYRHNDSNGHVCGLRQDHNIHHLENMVDHHEFQPAAAAAVSGD